MIGKIHAAVDARETSETLIIARTDARAVEGLNAALERADAYVDAGADVLFVEAPQSVDEIMQISTSFAHRLPLMANMVEGGKTPLLDAKGLQDHGFRLVIFPGGIVRAMALTARDYYANLISRGSNEAFADRMYDFDGLNKVIGTQGMLEQGKRYSETET